MENDGIVRQHVWKGTQVGKTQSFKVGKGKSFFIWKGEEAKRGLKIVYWKY